MHCTLRTDSQGRLRCTLRNPLGTIAGATVVGCFFCLVGSVFLFSSLPHTELLVVEREGRGFAFYRAQLLAGRWPIYERTTRSPGPCAAILDEDIDEGTARYMVVVHTPEGTIPYGKLTTERADVERQVEKLESFFRFPFESRLELREDVWWWFLSFFGILGLAMGLGVIGLVALADRWTFDRAAATVTHQRLLLLPISRRIWNENEVTGIRHVAESDPEGDTFHRLVLRLRSGSEVRMNSTSRAAREAPHLEDAARRISSHLGLG